MSHPLLIVVDDEPDMGEFICNVAQEAGFDAELFQSADAFRVNHNEHKNADIIVLDLMMPGMDGIEFIRYLSDVKCKSALILASGFDSSVLHSAQKLAQEQGLNIVGSLSKPFRYHELYQLITNISIEPKRSTYSPLTAPPSAEELRHAIIQEELVVYYQPQVSIKDRSITGVEALVRWQHPAHGLLLPYLFIPTAEEHGLIDDLTWVVLKQAINQCQQWFTDKDMHVAINISASTFKYLELPEHIYNLVRKNGLESSNIILEVTESVLMQELVKSLDILTRLRMKGFRLSIDDFGTGYSSMVQLHRAPFSEIKIDRSFVMEMGDDKEAEAIVETIIMLGHKLGMNVIAEGIETQSNWDQLQALGCDNAQGFFIAKPMPYEELMSWRLHWE